jgi:hypothetical protein
VDSGQWQVASHTEVKAPGGGPTSVNGPPDHTISAASSAWPSTRRRWTFHSRSLGFCLLYSCSSPVRRDATARLAERLTWCEWVSTTCRYIQTSRETGSARCPDHVRREVHQMISAPGCCRTWRDHVRAARKEPGQCTVRDGRRYTSSRLDVARVGLGLSSPWGSPRSD